MFGAIGIFQDFQLPNAGTWFYFSLMLATTLLFRFNRVISLHNWDLLTLFLLVPGFLILQEGHQFQAYAARLDDTPERERLAEKARLGIFRAYVWLMGGSLYLFVRCLVDLALIRRPMLSPNLNLTGLAFFTTTLFLGLGAVASRQNPQDLYAAIGSEPIALTRIQTSTTTAVELQGGAKIDDRVETEFWVRRGLAMAAHFGVILALILIGSIHFRDTTAGLASAALYLLLPYTAYHIAQVHHIWPTVFILWAVFCWRRATLSGILLGIAAGTTLFPLLLYPLWFGFYRSRGAGRHTFGWVAGVALSLTTTGLLLWGSGELTESWVRSLHLPDWQPWKAVATEGIWLGEQHPYRLPVFILCMAFLAVTVFWPSPRNLGHVIAQSAGVAISIQFWYADQGGVYILWYLPLLLITMFRPGLTDFRPPAIAPEDDWLRRWWGRQRLLRFRAFRGGIFGRAIKSE